MMLNKLCVVMTLLLIVVSVPESSGVRRRSRYYRVSEKKIKDCNNKFMCDVRTSRSRCEMNCIEKTQCCDGHYDCVDETDEKMCTTTTSTTPPTTTSASTTSATTTEG